jgi:hypothetical protein
MQSEMTKLVSFGKFFWILSDKMISLIHKRRKIWVSDGII